MGRKVSPPSYGLHKGSGQAYTRINGKMIYLGEYNSPESREKYAEIVSDWSAGNLDSYGQSVSVARICIAYLKHAESYYRKNGEPTSQVHTKKSALRILNQSFGTMEADKFLPKHLEEMQQVYLQHGLSRGTINQYVNTIRAAFRFAVTKGGVSAPTWQALLAVRHLQRGRSRAKETKPVEPVSPLVVIRTLRYLGPVVRSMVRLQYVTGMRPGEVCMMQVRDLNRSGGIWQYTPEGHKTAHHGKQRIISFGRRAQRILEPYLNRTEDSYVFSPSDRFMKPREDEGDIRHYPEGYDRTSYRRAVDRVCKQEGIPHWTPNQLRHTYATIIRKRYGLEAAQILLGHSKADVTQVYAERDLQKAEQVVREVG